MGKANDEQYEQLILCQIVVDGGKEKMGVHCVCMCLHVRVHAYALQIGWLRKSSWRK